MSLSTCDRDSALPIAPFGAAAHLLRLHRHSLINLLVLGGTAEDRERVAMQFHGESPLRTGPFLALDCEKEQGHLATSLQFWLARSSRAARDNPLRAAARGTLFLNSIECLSRSTQRLLLMFADRSASARQDPGDADWAGRLTVGSAEDLAIAVADDRFLAALYDHLDKIRVELGPARQEGAA